MKTNQRFHARWLLALSALGAACLAHAAAPMAAKILVKGSPIHGANGLAFGPDGSLYWTSMLGGAAGLLAPGGEAKTPAVTPEDSRLAAGGQSIALCNQASRPSPP